MMDQATQEILDALYHAAPTNSYQRNVYQMGILDDVEPYVYGCGKICALRFHRDLRPEDRLEMLARGYSLGDGFWWFDCGGLIDPWAELFYMLQALFRPSKQHLGIGRKK